MIVRPATRGARPSELREAMSACWHAFIAIAVVSGLINILYLTGSFYMLEVYDRVLPSRSIPTLVALSILALTLFTFQGILDVIRSRVMVRIAATLDERLSARVYDIVVQLPLATRGQGDGLAPMRDLDQIRAFLVSTGPSALFDLPWMPFYLLICFLFHPWIGVAALIGALILTSLTLASEFMTRGPARMAGTHVGARNSLAEAGRRNAEVLQAMGMAPRMGKIWGEANSQVSRHPAADLRHRRRPRRGLQGAALHLAVGRARARRLSGDPGSRRRRASSSRARSSWRARWRRWSSRSPTGEASFRHARAGGACPTCCAGSKPASSR